MIKLSDGTIARVGMIVVVLDNTDRNGNLPNTITKINNIEKHKGGCSIKCLWIGHKNGEMYEANYSLRRATAKERRLFNKQQKL